MEVEQEKATRKKNVRNALTYIAVIAIFGGLVPFEKGLGFFDPVILAAYACIGIVFSGPAAVVAFAKRPASLGQAVQWIVRTALLGELLAVGMIGCGIGVVYATSRGYVFAPDIEVILYGIALGAAASLAMSALAAWVTLQVSSGAARMALRGVFLVLLVLFYLYGRDLPNVMEAGILVSLIATGAFLALLKLHLAKVPA